MGLTIRLWAADPETGDYPLLRFLWCILWVGPICLTILLFVFLTFVQGGTSAAKEAWEMFYE
jgi:hypothetical protein